MGHCGCGLVGFLGNELAAQIRLREPAGGCRGSALIAAATTPVPTASSRSVVASAIVVAGPGSADPLIGLGITLSDPQDHRIPGESCAP
jgi:hypothetical protein